MFIFGFYKRTKAKGWTQNQLAEKLTSRCVAVQRVCNLSGGNYWGMETADEVAAYIKALCTS